MGSIGHRIRMRRISDPRTGRFLIVPMDHGTTLGPIDGITEIRESIGLAREGGATSVVIHKGCMEPGLADAGGRIGVIMHLSVSTDKGPDPNRKVLVGTVEEALRLGADAVSIHVNLGADTESEMIMDFGNISEGCRKWGVPLLAMVYPRGDKVPDPHDVEAVKHAARLGAELGADIIKTNYTGSVDTFKEVTRACPVPVVIAGGPRMETDRDVLQMVKDSIEAGGKGVSIGRNIFQHSNPAFMVRAVRKIISEGSDIEEALKEIQG